eukprot:scaffold526916_cov18-Prasinocladus_malaysianus.AAC.1
MAILDITVAFIDLNLAFVLATQSTLACMLWGSSNDAHQKPYDTCDRPIYGAREVHHAYFICVCDGCAIIHIITASNKDSTIQALHITPLYLT